MSGRDTPTGHAFVGLTFDVDADPAQRETYGEPPSDHLGKLSWGRYSVARGLPRILDLLEALDVKATFFVPGATVDQYQDAIRDVAARGHEIAHHGYNHYPPHRVPDDVQRDEIVGGIRAIEDCIGTAPLGYRAPAWEITPTTFRLLVEHGLQYDSSLMGDDRPYIETNDDGSLIELPVHWFLDDFPHFAALSGFLSPMRDPDALFALWGEEIDLAVKENRASILTFHPEVIGRGWTFRAFADFVERLRDDPRVTLARCADIAATVPGNA